MPQDVHLKVFLNSYCLGPLLLCFGNLIFSKNPQDVCALPDNISYNTGRPVEGLYLEYLCPNWLSPPPLPPARVSPPPVTKAGVQHSLAGEGAGGANSDDFRESLSICLLSGVDGISCSGCVLAVAGVHAAACVLL